MEHSVGITKGKPLKRGMDPKTEEPLFSPQWHFVCSCGDRGEDGPAVYAQSMALSHQGGEAESVRRRVAGRRDPHHPTVHLSLACGHTRHDKTEHPGEYTRLKVAFCDSCWTPQDVTGSEVTRLEVASA